jgi:hypothetical protein
MGKEKEDLRLAAIKALHSFSDHLTPRVHKLVGLLEDKSPEVRRAAAEALSHSGPASAVYADRMLAQFDMDGNVADVEQAAWMLNYIGWTPPKVVPSLIRYVLKRKDPGPLDFASIHYPIAQEAISNAPESNEIRDAILSIPAGTLRQSMSFGWVRRHAAGDRRFVKPLLEALHADWVDNAWTYTAEITEALVAVGRGDEELPRALVALLKKEAPVNARLYVARALSQLTGDANHLADGLVDVLKAGKQNDTGYTSVLILELVSEVGPAAAGRLKPYHEMLAEMVRQCGHYSSPAGYFVLTGDTEPVMAWARNNLEEAAGSGMISGLLDTGVYQLGPLAEPMLEEIVRLAKNGTDWNRHALCRALAAVGPNRRTSRMGAELADLAERFAPGCRAAPALALWVCCRKTDAALGILVPLLEDEGCGTTDGARALGEMGRDAKSAVPRLRQVASGANPAYAQAAREAVERIEKDLARKAEPRQLYEELGSEDYLVSIRALWRLVDGGKSAAAAIKELIEQDKTPQLPGRKIRQQARARQALAIMEPPAEK